MSFACLTSECTAQHMRGTSSSSDQTPKPADACRRKALSGQFNGKVCIPARTSPTFNILIKSKLVSTPAGEWPACLFFTDTADDRGAGGLPRYRAPAGSRVGHIIAAGGARIRPTLWRLGNRRPGPYTRLQEGRRALIPILASQAGVSLIPSSQRVLK